MWGGRRFRGDVAGCLLTVGLQFVATSAWCEDVRRYDLSIAEPELKRALRQLARQTDSRLLFPHTLTGSGDFVRLEGRYTLDDALDRLLRNTDFSGRVTEHGVITISRRLDQQSEETDMRGGRNTLMTGASALFFGLTGFSSAFGQETESSTIVVTGFRAAQASALEAKRESNQIIESITAEDFGKFPDQNIAESLQRLPGVQIDRANGQGTKVRIRGLDQNVVVLNDESFLSGLEIFRIGEGNDRQDSSLEGIPSELIAGVDVYKSPNASLVSGGLGGLINLKTRNARDIKGDSLIAGDLRFDQGSGTDWQPVGSVVFGRKFSDAFAVLASVSYARTDINTDVLGGDNRGNWAYDDRPVGSGIVSPTNPATSTIDAWSPEYRYVTSRDQERERFGASVNIDWAVSDSVRLVADWFHADNSILTSEASLKFPFNSEGATYQTGAPLEVNGNGVLLRGRVEANSAEGISFVDNAESSTDNLQLKASWDNGGRLSAEVQAVWAHAEFERTAANNDVRYTQYGVRNGTAAGLIPNPTAPTTLEFDYVNGPFPTFTPTTPEAFNTPTSVFAKSHWVFGEATEIDTASLRADFKYRPEFGEATDMVVSFGGRYAVRTIDSEFGRYLADYSGKGELNAYELGLGDWTPYGYFQDGGIGYKSCELPVGTPNRPNCSAGARFGDSPALITPYQTASTNPERFELVNVGGINALFQNRGQMENGVSWIQALYPDTPFSFFQEPVESFEVEEKTSAAYIMADIQKSEDLFVNLGVRIVKTELTIDSNGTPPQPWFWGTDSWNGVLGNPTPIRTVREYTDILPSLNIVWDVSDQDKIRFAAARVVARQNLFDLGRGSQFNFTRSTDPGPNQDRFLFTNGSGGNPELEPYRANQFDITFERYFGSQGLLAAGLFYKAVDSFNVNRTVPRSVADQSVEGATTGSYSSPANGGSGSIKGFELAGKYAFDFGVGFDANYTYSSSESPYSNSFDSGLPIPGVAEHAMNATVFYERDRLEGRLSYAWRDDLYVRDFGFGDYALGIYEKARGQLDAQIGFDVTDAFKLTVEGINLTEEDTEQYLQFEELPLRFVSGDRRVLVGGRFRFGG